MLPELHLICMCADAVVGMPAIALVGVDVDILPNSDTSAANTSEIGLGFIVKGAYPMKVLADVCPGIFTGGTPVGAELNKSGLEAVMTALEFALLTRSEVSFLSF